MEEKKSTGTLAKHRPAAPAEGERPCYTPPVDIFETPEEVTLTADMPGVGKDDLDIAVERDLLTIRGRVKTEPPKDAELVYAEYRVGDYRRDFTLSDDIDREKISAEVKNGVLTLTLPKAERSKPRKISVAGE